jgi:hypothetical protein
MAKPDLQNLKVAPKTGRIRRDDGKLGLADANLHNLPDAANDGAAATAGVAIGGLYRNGSVLMVRVA